MSVRVVLISGLDTQSDFQFETSIAPTYAAARGPENDVVPMKPPDVGRDGRTSGQRELCMNG